MSYRHTLEAALESLHEIEELVKGFPGNGKIPTVEIDLTLQKLRNVYELFLLFKKPQDEASVSAPVATTTATATPAPAPTAAAIAAPEPAPEPAPAIAAAAVPGENKSSGEFQTLSDQFKGRTTLHESFHQTFSKEGETLRHTKPVLDLMKAIGINDRYTFIRELFNNDVQVFENTIKNLNDAPNFNDAYNYMIQHYNWDMDSEAVQLLLEIIRRKFIIGRHE